MELETIKDNIIEFVKNSSDDEFITYLNGFITEYRQSAPAELIEQKE